MIRMMQSGTVFKVSIFESKFSNLIIHQLYKFILTSGYIFCNTNSCIRT